MATTQPLIAISHIGKRFGGVHALTDVSLEIDQGEVHAIVGENGAGKSTLMNILSGVIAEYDGQLLLRGQLARFTGPRDAEQAGVGIVHQELNLVEPLSAAANLFLGRERRTLLGWLDDRGMERAATTILETLECRIDPRQPVGELRVGDQQLVEIGKALVQEAEILILDEPTSALTAAESERLFRVMQQLQTRGVTILYISHKMEEVFRLADRISILRDGALIRTLPRRETTPREVTRLMVGRDLETAAPTERPAPGRTLLEVCGLSLPWAGHARAWRLHDISFTLRQGEVLGVAGLMGAGRTELLECLFGASAEPPRGAIRLNGAPAVFRHPAAARAAGLALVTEDRKRLGLFDQMTVGQNLTLCQLHAAAAWGIVQSRRESDMAETLIASLGIKTAGRDAPITSLSGGNQQKCVIGRWLLTRPQVLLLDDPTRGVDVGAKAELYRLIDQLCRDGLGVLVTSSELPELLTLCDRILVLCEGRLTGEFTRAEATEHGLMEAATMCKPAGTAG